MSRMEKVEGCQVAPVEKTGAVPRLRFKNDNGEAFSAWEEKRLGDVFAERTQRGMIDGELLSVTMGRGVVKATDVGREDGASSDLSNYKCVVAGDVAYNSMRMWQGASGVADTPGIVSPAYTVVYAAEPENHHMDFWGYYLKHPTMVGYFERYSQGLTSDNWNLKYPSFAKVPARIPSVEEQRKIASFFSSIDTKLDTLRQKKDALTHFKTGLMQKIFSQEIRFAREDGSAFPEWEEKRLGGIFQERSSRGNPHGELLSVTMDRGIVKTADMDRSNNSSADRSNYKSVEVGDIAYNSMRMWQGASGVADTPGIVSPAYTVVYAKAPQVMAYWGYHLKVQGMIRLFERYSQGLTSDTWNLKYPAFARIPVQVPCLGEQRVIADALSAVEDKIAAVTDQIIQTETFKKGLLQQMFV